MSDTPETIYVTKSVLADGKVEKILAYQIPTTTDWIGASGRWKHIRIDSYYVHKTEDAAMKAGKRSLQDTIAMNAARNEFLESLECKVVDATDGAAPATLKHAAE